MAKVKGIPMIYGEKRTKHKFEVEIEFDEPVSEMDAGNVLYNALLGCCGKEVDEHE